MIASEYCPYCQNTHWTAGAYGYALRYGCSRQLLSWEGR